METKCKLLVPIGTGTAIGTAIGAKKQVQLCSSDFNAEGKMKMLVQLDSTEVQLDSTE